MSTKFSDLWEQVSSEKEPKSDSKFSSLWDQASQKKGALEKTARVGARLGIGAAQTALLPYEVATMPLSSKGAQHGEYRKSAFEDIERLMEQKQTGVWDEGDEQLLQSLMSQIQNPEEAEQHVQTADLGISSLAEKGAEQLGYDLKPEGWEEHAAQLVGNFKNPKQLLNMAKNAPKAIKGILNKEARTLIKSEKNWNRLATVAKDNPEKETLLKFAKDRGLTPEETNLLFKAEGNVPEYLRKIARKTKKYKGVVQGLKDKLGAGYEELKALGREGGYLNFEESSALGDKVSDLLSGMKNTLVVPPEVNVVEKALENSMNQGVTVETLINSRQNLSRGINWKDIDRGDFYKKELRDVFTKAIEEKNPYVSSKLKELDKSWAKYEKYKPVLDKKLPLVKFNKFEVPAEWLAPAAFGFATLKGATLLPAAIYGGLEVIRRMATRALIDPKFNKPFMRLQHSMINGDKSGFKKSFIAIKNIMKEEDPDLYEEMKDLNIE